MPRLIIDQRNAQDHHVRHLALCYLCGESFGERTATDQHVVGKKAFATADRERGMFVMDAHDECQNHLTHDEDKLAKLVSRCWGKEYRDREYELLHPELHDHALAGQFATVMDVHLEMLVFTWAQAAHIALYGEYLGAVPFSFVPPWPATNVIPGPFHRIDDVTHRRWHEAAAVEIERCSRIGRIDVVEFAGGAFNYECFWTPSQQGAPACFFRVRLYDWQKLALDGVGRDCVGVYRPQSRVPANASCEFLRDTAIVPPAGAREPGEIHTRLLPP